MPDPARTEAQPTPGDDGGADGESGRAAKGWSAGRIAASAAAIAIILFWIWVFTGGPKKQNPDYLSDRDWVTSAEATCTATVARIDRLPPASESGTATARATVIDRATDQLEAMIDDLASPLPTGDGDAAVTRQWLADYRTYVGDRRDYAEALRANPNAKMLVDEKYSDPLDTVLKTFADVNDMPTCAPPGDVA